MANYRNPNGYGSVVKLSGNRRKPYAVRKTTGYDDRAYPIYSIIGYYQTRKEALMALSEYNHDPYDIELSKATFSEVYELWSKVYFEKMKPALQQSYRAAYKHCSSIYDMSYKSLRKMHMQSCIDSCTRGYSTKANIKLLFSQLDKFAFDNDIISKCYSANLNVGEKEESTKHSVFTDDEVVALSKLRGQPYVDETLFMLYTGCRVSEMLQLKCSEVHIEEKYCIGGLKTKYSKNRTIPLHEELIPIVKDHLSDQNYLFYYKPDQETKSFSTAYIAKWADAMKNYGFNHLTHDCRHTVRSKLDSAGANKVAIDRIMGHSSNSVGEKVYTHKTLAELLETINKIVYSNGNSSALVTR